MNNNNNNINNNNCSLIENVKENKMATLLADDESNTMVESDNEPKNQFQRYNRRYRKYNRRDDYSDDFDEPSVLEDEYIDPKRPYSQNELKHMRSILYRRLRLSNMRVQHLRSGHFYNVKEGGRKHKEMKESNSNDVGSCSVTWKLSRTPRHLKNRARALIRAFEDTFEGEQVSEFKLTHFTLDIERSFYIWLYEEFN